MNGQIEREYRETLDELRFSGEARARMAEALAAGQAAQPVKGKRLRPLRAGLIAAAVCALLVGTAGAATLAARQARINFFDSEEELMDAQRARVGKDGEDFGMFYMIDNPQDYDELSFMDVGFWWNGEEAETLVEEASGAEEDGWTGKRVFRFERNGQTYLRTKYKADVPSGFDGLWKSWDTAWLEEHYTAVAEHTIFEDTQTGGEPYQGMVTGEFRGQGDTVFNLQYDWTSDVVWGDEDHLTTGLDHYGVYTTADGVEATIMTAGTHSGKTLFWVSAIFGHGRFSMFGTQVDMGELHTILDSLNLSNLLEYVPAE